MLFSTTQFAECHMQLRKSLSSQRHDTTDVDVETSNDASHQHIVSSYSITAITTSNAV